MLFLIILSLLSVWIMVGNSDREPNWRLALVQTLILWGIYLSLGTEILGVFNAINRLSISLMWLLPILIGILWVWIWLKQRKVLRLPIIYHRDSWAGLVLDFLVILILIVTAWVAIVAPPNSSEAMVTRMSRVAHWEQNQSLAHYPTGIEAQNNNSPGAELIMLNFFLLVGHDGAVNVVAWLFFAGSVAAVASLAEVFGANHNGQRMAAIFTASLPVAITQATGALNDIVVAFWVVSAVLMLLYYSKQTQKSFVLITAACAASLAILTKPTAFIFLWPFALYMVVILRKRMGMVKMLMWAAIAFVIIGGINAGHFYRNQKTYGQFYRPVELSEQMNEIRNFRVLVSNISRNASLHADLPFPRADNWFKTNLHQLHDVLDINVSDPRTTMGEEFFIPQVNTSEMTSGNPIHAVIVVLSLIIIVVMVKMGKEKKDFLIYIGLMIFSLLLFCYYLKWQPSGGRLHLPFFMLLAPMLAILVDRLEKFDIEIVIAVLMLAYAMPWLFQTQERPVFPDINRTYPVSIFHQERSMLYFTSNPDDYPFKQAIADEIISRGIHEIGLDLLPNSAEYQFWALLGPVDNDVRIEWITTETASAQYLREDFSPGAIICEKCTSEAFIQYSENREHLAFGTFDVFLKE